MAGLHISDAPPTFPSQPHDAEPSNFLFDNSQQHLCDRILTGRHLKSKARTPEYIVIWLLRSSIERGQLFDDFTSRPQSLRPFVRLAGRDGVLLRHGGIVSGRGQPPLPSTYTNSSMVRISVSNGIGLVR